MTSASVAFGRPHATTIRKEYDYSRLSNVIQLRAPLRVVLRPLTCPARILQDVPHIPKTAFARNAKQASVIRTIAESYGGDGA